MKYLGKSRGGGGSFWLGATDLQVGFVWNHSGLIVNKYFTDWSAGKYRNSRPNSAEDCLEIRDEGNYQWNVALCESRKSFVCQMEKIQEGLR